MKILITILLFFWASNSYGIACTASKTNKDPTVIAKCHAKMLSHFEEILKEQLAFNYAHFLKNQPEQLENPDFMRSIFFENLTSLEQVQRMLNKLNYPDPRPTVRCETPGSG